MDARRGADRAAGGSDDDDVDDDDEETKLSANPAPRKQKAFASRTVLVSRARRLMAKRNCLTDGLPGYCSKAIVDQDE